MNKLKTTILISLLGASLGLAFADSNVNSTTDSITNSTANNIETGTIITSEVFGEEENTLAQIPEPLDIQEYKFNFNSCIPDSVNLPWGVCVHYSLLGLKQVGDYGDDDWFANLLLKSSILYKNMDIYSPSLLTPTNADLERRFNKMLKGFENGDFKDLSIDNRTWEVSETYQILAKDAEFVAVNLQFADKLPGSTTEETTNTMILVNQLSKSNVGIWELFNQPEEVMKPIIQREWLVANCVYQEQQSSEQSSLEAAVKCKSDIPKLTQFSMDENQVFRKNFSLSKQGLSFSYTDMELGGVSGAEVQLTIPLYEIKSYLKPFFLELINNLKPTQSSESQSSEDN